MDSLTQIVLGSAVAEATLGRKVGNKALLWGGIAGTIPDLDVLFIALFGNGAIDEIVIHRGFSHSITFAVLMAPLLGWLVHNLYKKKNEAGFKGWTLLFFLAIFTHPLLDSLTTYGTQLFLPFSDYRVSIATVFVVDIFYTLPFLLSVIALSFVSRTNGLRRHLNYLGLGLSTSYLILGLVNKMLVTDVFKADLTNEADGKELVFVGTTPLNVALWYGVAETDSAFHVGYYSFFDEDKEVDWVGFKKNHHLISDIEDEYGIDRLKWFSDQLYVLTEQHQDSINFYTLKFGRSKFEDETPEGSFLFYMKVVREPDGSLSYISVREPDVDKMGEQLNGLYRRILGDRKVF